LCLVMLISIGSFRRTFKGDFFLFFTFMYVIQHCFIWHPSDSTVSEDAGIEPITVATLALTVRRSNHLARSHPPYSAKPAQRISHTGPAMLQKMDTVPAHVDWQAVRLLRWAGLDGCLLGSSKIPATGFSELGVIRMLHSSCKVEF
jgi:hypothetical protein